MSKIASNVVLKFPKMLISNKKNGAILSKKSEMGKIDNQNSLQICFNILETTNYLNANGNFYFLADFCL